jgi:hypothetical protein
MGYKHIDNLYKNQAILLFKECYALEKIHGTSAHITWDNGAITYFPGGEKLELFVTLFDEAKLREAFTALGHAQVTVFGEAYGGKTQGQSWRYGRIFRFVAFEVAVGEAWLSVPDAAEVVAKLGLEFVYYKRIPAELSAIDAERDAPSEQAKRNGIEGDQPREGVVLRPLEEMVRCNCERVVAKHKRDEERETRTPRQVNTEKAAILREAQAIADEWVTPTRLAHVLDKLGPVGLENMPEVIRAMIEDVTREAKGEIVDSKEARKAISSATVKLFKAQVQAELYEK